MGMGKDMKIGEFAKATGIPIHTLRRLDIGGKLVASVSLGGHRTYSELQLIEAEKFVKKMKLLSGGKNVVSAVEDLDDFFAYLLGLIFADGTVLASGQVQLEMKDKQIIEDVAKVLGSEIHYRAGRRTWRITVPRIVANKLVEHGVCRRKSKGFDIQEMSERSFGCFLRGLFDGDGSARERGGCRTIRFHGHPRAMAHIQTTLLEHFKVYMAWVPDNRLESGMLEISSRTVINFLYNILYRVDGVLLLRKKKILNKEDKVMGMG